MHRNVLKIELGGTDLFQHVKTQTSHDFPSILPIFSSIVMCKNQWFNHYSTEKSLSRVRSHHIMTVTTSWSTEVNFGPFSTNRGSIRDPNTIFGHSQCLLIGFCGENSSESGVLCLKTIGGDYLAENTSKKSLVGHKNVVSGALRAWCHGVTYIRNRALNQVSPNSKYWLSYTYFSPLGTLVRIRKLGNWIISIMLYMYNPQYFAV